MQQDSPGLRPPLSKDWEIRVLTESQSWLFCTDDVKEKKKLARAPMRCPLGCPSVSSPSSLRSPPAYGLNVQVSRRQEEEEEETSGLLLAQEGFSQELQCRERPLFVSKAASPKGGGARREQEPRKESRPEAKRVPLQAPILFGAAGTDDFCTPGGAAAPALGLAAMRDGRRWNSVSGSVSLGAAPCLRAQGLLGSQ